MTNSFYLNFSRSIAVSFALLGSSLCLAAEDIGETIVVSGTIEALACAEACDVCCPTHSIVDPTGTISLQVGNSFVDLSEVSGDQQLHQFSGYLYESTAQCSTNQCTFFTVESLDQALIPAPSYDSNSETLTIETVTTTDEPDSPFTVILSPPFNLDSVISQDDKVLVEQGGDCSALESSCSNGSACLSYFGVAGSSGPQFQTCEISCSHPGASCPIGQSCTTIADGPGEVCVVD